MKNLKRNEKVVNDMNQFGSDDFEMSEDQWLDQIECDDDLTPEVSALLKSTLDPIIYNFRFQEEVCHGVDFESDEEAEKAYWDILGQKYSQMEGADIMKHLMFGINHLSTKHKFKLLQKIHKEFYKMTA